MRATDLPPGALVLITRDDTPLRALVESGTLHQVAAISEPDDPPYYFLIER